MFIHKHFLHGYVRSLKAFEHALVDFKPGKDSDIGGLKSHFKLFEKAHVEFLGEIDQIEKFEEVQIVDIEKVKNQFGSNPSDLEAFKNLFVKTNIKTKAVLDGASVISDNLNQFKSSFSADRAYSLRTKLNEMVAIVEKLEQASVTLCNELKKYDHLLLDQYKLLKDEEKKMKKLQHNIESWLLD